MTEAFFKVEHLTKLFPVRLSLLYGAGGLGAFAKWHVQGRTKAKHHMLAAVHDVSLEVRQGEC